MVDAEDRWEIAQKKDNAGYPIVFRYRVLGAQSSVLFTDGQGIFITWAYDPDERNGMPPVDENDRQVKFEGALDTMEDGATGLLMQVTTGGGRKEWFYIVENADDWMSAFNEVLADHEPYPLQIEILADPWRLWSDLSGIAAN